MNEQEKLRLLASGTPFASLAPAALEQLAASFEPTHVPGGSVLMREGEPADSLYVVVHGRLQAAVTGDDGSVLVVGEIVPGEVVGEMALLSDEPRSATVTATRDTLLLALPRAAFERALATHPGVMVEVGRMIVARLERSIHGRRMESPVRTVTVVPAGGEQEPDDIATQLVAALRPLGNVTMVNRERVTEALGSEHADAARDEMPALELGEWLHHLEVDHEVVIYVTDTLPSPWSQRCLRQADRVLLAAHAEADPRPGAVEHSLLSEVSAYGVRRDLLLVQPAHSAVPRPAGPWLSHRSVTRHYHAREGSQSDWARLARFVTGRALHVVFSGGGARGLAHFGVLRAMSEAGYPADYVGGSSFGALAAGMSALGAGWKEMRDRAIELLVESGSPIDLTAPVTSLAHGKKVAELIPAAFGSALIEDLWHPFYCVSSNLSRGEVEVHDRGLLWVAIRTSVSIPGVFPPVRSPAGDVLVDGAVMNNLPVDIMRARYDGGPVWAVNLRGPIDMPASGLSEIGVMSGWRQLGRRLNPFASQRRVPGIIEVMLRTTEIGNVLSTKLFEQDADLVFRPPVGGFALLDWAAADDIIEAGYRHAVEVLERQSPTV